MYMNKRKLFYYRLVRILGIAVSGLIVIFFFSIMVYPVIWMFIGSLKNTTEFYSNIWGLPSKPEFANYTSAWIEGGLGQKYLNSLLITSGSLVLVIAVNCCASYAIARIRFRLKTVIYLFLLSGIMMPSGVLGIPTFSVALKMGLNNTRGGLILVYAAQSIAMGVFIMRSFFISLPRSLEEAAMIDGCTKLGGFIRVILPLAKAGIMTQVVFSGLSIWNEYFMANIMINRPSLHTLPLAVANFVGQHSVNYPVLFALLSLVTIPVITVYVVAQKSFVEGVTAGSVKG